MRHRRAVEIAAAFTALLIGSNIAAAITASNSVPSSRAGTVTVPVVSEELMVQETRSDQSDLDGAAESTSTSPDDGTDDDVTEDEPGLED